VLRRSRSLYFACDSVTAAKESISTVPIYFSLASVVMEQSSGDQPDLALRAQSSFDCGLVFGSCCWVWSLLVKLAPLRCSCTPGFQRELLARARPYFVFAARDFRLESLGPSGLAASLPPEDFCCHCFVSSASFDSTPLREIDKEPTVLQSGLAQFSLPPF
jgi:hypothetical protein